MQGFLERVKLEAVMADGRVGRLRHAIVAAVDPKTHTVKVTIQPEGVESGWIPDPGFAAGGLKIACPSEVGTQVVVAPVEGDIEQSVIVARIFDSVMMPPLSPVTGDAVQPGEIGFFTKQGAYLHLSASGIAIGGDLRVSGGIMAEKDIVGAGISISKHKHGAVQSGQDVSGTPLGAQG